MASFHVWLPNLFQFKGGIQVYSSFLLDALQNSVLTDNCHVFLKHDTGVPPGYSPKMHFHLAGRWPAPLCTPAFATQLLGQGLHRRPTLIIVGHLNFTPVAYWLKRLAGIPYWAIAHGIEAWTIKSPQMYKSLRYADKILTVSTYTRNRLAEEIDLQPSDLELLPNTFDHHQFQIGPKPAYLLDRYGLKPDQPVMLTVARLAGRERYKGYDQIMRALPQIRESVPNVRYIIAGKGDDRKRIEEVVSRLNLQDTVSLVGFVPDHELCDHYNLSDLFAMPSKREGFGIVYLEALACGKPTIGGNQDGAMDALRQGELGVLVNPDDISEIGHAIIQILNKTYVHPRLFHPEELRRMVIDTFGYDQFRQKLSGHLQQQLNL